MLEGRLYEVGGMEFESLVDLVNFYEKNPLYKKVKLSQPINRNTLNRIGSMRVSNLVSTLGLKMIDLFICRLPMIRILSQGIWIPLVFKKD